MALDVMAEGVTLLPNLKMVGRSEWIKIADEPDFQGC
jgi:hypothetical protein